MLLDAEDLAAFGAVVADFAGHAERVLFDPQTEGGPDGDLGAVGSLLEEARGLGLLADPTTGDADEAGPSEDYGIWGAHVMDEGCRLSLTSLATLGGACAGMAAAMHAHGVGRVGIAAATSLPGVSVDAGIAAAFVPAYGVALDHRTRTDAVQLRAVGGSVRVRGCSPFVWSAGRPDWLAVAARDADADSGWRIVAVRTDAPGVRLESLGPRVGIRATEQHRVVFDDVAVSPDAVLASGERAAATVARLVALDWLGCAAISLGAARAALRQATEYATSRRQGGGPIIQHAAVQLLLADAAHHITSLEAVLERYGCRPLRSFDPATLIRWAVTARLGIAEHAAVAVTNSLQVHGGYGYMDDYGLSKRLRDVHALASRHGSRDQLLLTLHHLDADAAATVGEL